MHTLEELNLTYLCITTGWWGKDDNLPRLRRRAAQKGQFVAGEEREYFFYIVHKDTEIVEGQMEFPHDVAYRTALDLGKL